MQTSNEEVDFAENFTILSQDEMQSAPTERHKIYFVAVDKLSINKEQLDNKWSAIQFSTCLKAGVLRALNGDECVAYAVTATSAKTKILLSQEVTLSYDDVYSESERGETASRKMDVGDINQSREPKSAGIRPILVLNWHVPLNEIRDCKEKKIQHIQTLDCQSDHRG
ncbi:hypothetical protein FQA39_LY00521 [Lamprigera yunnana]|nr:hypothetical protein FQA39_LY00521 [Lamprigera yunnana]